MVFSRSSLFVTLLPSVGYLDCRCLQLFALCAKSAHMPCVPQKPVFVSCFQVFSSWSWPPSALRRKEQEAKKGQNKAPKRLTNQSMDQFSNLSSVIFKITGQNGHPEPPWEPPERSRGPPGRPKMVSRSAQSAPGWAQELPRALRELPRNGSGVTCRPSAPQRPLGGHY